MKDIKDLTIGEIVTNDFRAASVFKRFGLDFCCGGNQNFSDACKQNDIDPDELEKALRDVQTMNGGPSHDYKSWKLDFLSDYIVNVHHAYVQNTLADLLADTERIARVHGLNHPELLEVRTLFFGLAKELGQHLKHEEDDLFPAIKKVLATGDPAAKAIIVSEISRMKGEHDFAGGVMDKINLITNGYKLPADACRTYEVTFQYLEEFEDDLHTHVHLENNILYPRALELAKS